MITLFGIAWILLSAFLVVRGNDLQQIILLLVSGLFQSSAIVNAGSFSLSPFLFTEILILLRFLILSSGVKNKRNFFVVPKYLWLLILFMIWAAIVTLLMPSIFVGIRVYPARIGIDENFALGGSPLVPSAGNYVQLVLLLINFLTLFVVGNFFAIQYTAYDSFYKKIKYILFIPIFIGLWQYSSSIVHFIPFPESFFFSNAAHALLTSAGTDFGLRLTSTFSEASFAGQYFAAIAIFYLVSLKENILFSFLAIICLLLTFSGTGYISFAVGICVLLFRLKNNKLLFCFIFVCLAVMFYLFGGGDLISHTVTGKIGTQSGDSRIGSDIFAINILKNTYFLGAGLGSSRTSSFLFCLLSNVGIIGSILFFLFIFNLIKDDIRFKSNNKLQAGFILIIVLIAQFLGIPDLSNPTMWVFIILTAIQIKFKDDKVNS